MSLLFLPRAPLRREDRSNATTTTFALDRETGAPTPCGIAGDVYVASHALAEGYLNDPEKTAARFLPASHAVIEFGCVTYA